MKKPKSALVAMLMFVSMVVQAQTIPLQLTGTAGDSFKNNTYQLDWSIGEIMTETYSGNLNMITQGFHQGKYLVTSIGQLNDTQPEISAYPNPATDFIQVKIGNEKPEDFRFSLYDVTGKVLQNGNFSSNQQKINLAGKATGTYFLHVSSAQTTVKIFKIIKSN